MSLEKALELDSVLAKRCVPVALAVCCAWLLYCSNVFTISLLRISIGKWK